jgi:hypothetical protein
MSTKREQFNPNSIGHHLMRWVKGWFTTLEKAARKP